MREGLIAAKDETGGKLFAHLADMASILPEIVTGKGLPCARNRRLGEPLGCVPMNEEEFKADESDSGK